MKRMLNCLHSKLPIRTGNQMHFLHLHNHVEVGLASSKMLLVIFYFLSWNYMFIFDRREKKNSTCLHCCFCCILGRLNETAWHKSFMCTTNLRAICKDFYQGGASYHKMLSAVEGCNWNGRKLLYMVHSCTSMCLFFAICIVSCVFLAKDLISL